jgi:photosystem II stability/assembly factor-like uncharacterized protein
MIDDPLDRLRASNPTPDRVPPPPLEFVLMRLDDGRTARRPWRTRAAGWALAALGVAAAVAVTVVAVVLADHRPAASQSTPALTTGLIPTPRFGMRGVVMLDSAAFPAPQVGLLSIEQCYPCRAPAAQVNRTWQAISRDDGRSWRVVSGPALVAVQFSGTRDGWGIGLRYRHSGATTESLYVSHTGAETWSAVSIPTGFSIASVSVAAGTVWATVIRTGCPGRTGAGCAAIVLRGPAAGGSLSPATTQPPLAHSGPQIFAADADTAYIDADVFPGNVRHLVTRDGGRTWQTLPAYCSQAGADTTLTLDGPRSLWRFCTKGGSTSVLGRSTDGGVHWRTFRLPGHDRGAAPYRFAAVSSQVAWLMSDHGDVTRTTDGGRTWQQVWSRAISQHTLVKGIPETLTAVNSQSAYIAVVIPPKGGLTTGTYIASYQTHNGGQSWRTTLVPLPQR